MPFPYRLSRVASINLLDRQSTMFETSISIAPKNQGRTASVASVLLHVGLAIVLFTIAVPDAIQQRFRATPVYLPPDASTVSRSQTTQPVRRIIAPKLAPKLASAMLWSRPVKAKLAIPEAPTVPMSPAPLVTLSLPPVPAVPPPPVATRKAEIRTGGFESVLVGQPIPAAAGFQPALSPENLPARPLPAHAAVATGAFGDGTPTPAAKNTRTAVANGAFGDSTETIAARTQRGTVASTQFDSVAAKPLPRIANASTGIRSPLEITYKPRPLYTEEARRLRIEGEVVLQVMFRASSEICVLHVLHSLGHGLDENAISAASQINFRPATDGGRPIDDVATVRITFQLAE
jgi:TonB family protein